MQDVIDYFIKNPFKINLGCITQCSLPHLKSERFSMAIPINLNFIKDINGNGIPDTIYLTIESQFRDQIVRRVGSLLCSVSKKSFIDVRSSKYLSWNSHNKHKYIVSNLLNYEQSNFISNSRIIADYIMDHCEFRIPNTVLNNNSLLKHSGYLREKAIWMDPIYQWDDNFVLMFNSVLCDVSNISISSNYHQFNSHLYLSFDLKCELVNPEVVYIFEDDYMKNFQQYKQEDRDKKIDYILNDTKFRSNSQFGVYSNNQLES